MRYLLDLSAISEPLRPKPASGVMRNLREHGGETAIPAPVWHELQYGCARIPPSQSRQAIECFVESVVLASFPILDYYRSAADWHALERARLAAGGNSPPFVNGQIGAITHVNDFILISSLIGNFKAIQGLKLRSWA
ncbi:MAG: hypothetical protein OXC26_23120 [Albidovulum sp.]|nr:hypothetical protein [Albidovulum sp.]